MLARVIHMESLAIER